MCLYLRNASTSCTVYVCYPSMSSSVSFFGENSSSSTSCWLRLINKQPKDRLWANSNLKGILSENSNAYRSCGKHKITCSRWKGTLPSSLGVHSPNTLTSVQSRILSSFSPRLSKVLLHQALIRPKPCAAWESVMLRSYWFHWQILIWSL